MVKVLAQTVTALYR